MLLKISSAHFFPRPAPPFGSNFGSSLLNIGACCSMSGITIIRTFDPRMYTCSILLSLPSRPQCVTSFI